MTRSIDSYHSPDTLQVRIIPLDTKQAFIRAISLKLGEYAQDVRKAVQDELPHVFTIPERGQARPSLLPQPVQPPAPVGDVLTAAEQRIEQQYQSDLAAYKAEEDRVRFDQTTHDMQFKAAFADHEKRKAAYARNVTRAYDLLMSQFCSDVMKERLESQPDYDNKIRDHPIAASQCVRVLAHNPTRGRYLYACIYESLEQLLNIQQKDNESVVTYKDTF